MSTALNVYPYPDLYSAPVLRYSFTLEFEWSSNLQLLLHGTGIPLLEIPSPSPQHSVGRRRD